MEDFAKDCLRFVFLKLLYQAKGERSYETG